MLTFTSNVLDQEAEQSRRIDSRAQLTCTSVWSRFTAVVFDRKGLTHNHTAEQPSAPCSAANHSAEAWQDTSDQGGQIDACSSQINEQTHSHVVPQVNCLTSQCSAASWSASCAPQHDWLMPSAKSILQCSSWQDRIMRSRLPSSAPLSLHPLQDTLTALGFAW